MTAPTSTDLALLVAAGRVRRAESTLELARTPDRFGVTSRDWIEQCERTVQHWRREQARVARLAAVEIAA